MTYGFTNGQQMGKCSMDFTFCQFSQIDILKSGNVVPSSFHFITPDEMNMGVENQTVCFKSISHG